MNRIQIPPLKPAIQVAWPNGKRDHIPGFVSQQEAEGWIEGQASAWLSERYNATPFRLPVARPHLSSSINRRN
jgi:hypothetical protein